MEKRQLELHEIKQVALEVLIHFKLFCEENNIQYYLSNGTLLGAIKYKGFIPWDDDIDVFVPREDYNRMLNIYADTEKYKLFSVERNEMYRFPFSKLCDMTTRKEENNIDNGMDLGIDIDIFPLDSCAEHIYKSRKIRELVWLQKACSLSKFHSVEGKSFYKKWIIRYCQNKGFRHFVTRILQLVDKERCYGDVYKGCLVWPIYGDREIVSKEVFEDTIEVEFEGECFSAPIGYDKYLRSLYGDYNKDPSLEKQKTHHSFKAYRIGEV